MRKFENQSLGYLEETVLLLVAIEQNEAYGFSVTEEYRKHSGKKISLSAIHTVLRRLEKKGLVESNMRGATNERGGRRKRIFKINDYGLRILEEMQSSRSKLWGLIPGKY